MKPFLVLSHPGYVHISLPHLPHSDLNFSVPRGSFLLGEASVFDEPSPLQHRRRFMLEEDQDELDQYKDSDDDEYSLEPPMSFSIPEP